MVKKISATILVLTLAACGGSGGGSGDSEFSDKNLAITLTGSQSFNPSISHGAIDKFVVTISADDMDPVEEMVGGDAEGITVYGVAPGTQRRAEILAYNQNNVVIRRAFREGITVVAGNITKTSMAMKSVPIITNLNPDGAAVASNRINFEIFGEPGSKLNVIRVAEDESEEVMLDASTSAAWVQTTSEDGMFSFDPGTLGYGNYIFKVEDAETHESSMVTVALYKSLTRAGTVIGSGGGVERRAEELHYRSFGNPFYRMPDEENDNLGNTGLVDIWETIYEE